MLRNKLFLLSTCFTFIFGRRCSSLMCKQIASGSLSDCQLLILNVKISISQSVGRLCHYITKLLSMSLSLCLCCCRCLCLLLFFFDFVFLLVNDQMINYHWSFHISSSLHDHLSERSHSSSTALQCSLNDAEIKSDSVTLNPKFG